MIQLETDGISIVSDVTLAVPSSTPMRTFCCWEMAHLFAITALTAVALAATRLKTSRYLLETRLSVRPVSDAEIARGKLKTSDMRGHHKEFFA